MTASLNSLHAWLSEKIDAVLSRRGINPGWILWCDPAQEWRALLCTLSRDRAFDLWEADPGDPFTELRLRHRFAGTPRGPRIVWLPSARAGLRWFKVHELSAPLVWEKGLAMALAEYGVSQRQADLAELGPVLVHQAQAWLGAPKEQWRQWSPGGASGVVLDDERLFSTLADPAARFDTLATERLFEVFVQRCVDDFGLPAPVVGGESEWRVEAVARLLVAEAADACPAAPPLEPTRTIPVGLQRSRALKLLHRWLTHVHWMSHLERLVLEADGRLSLGWWARNSPTPPMSRGSRAVEEALFSAAVNRLDLLQDVDVLCRELEVERGSALARAGAFWGQHAKDKVHWWALAELALAASVLGPAASGQAVFRSPAEMVAWYTAGGHVQDEVGERLFAEQAQIPPALSRVRARLQQAWLRLIDRQGAQFSELLSASPAGLSAFPTAGELGREQVEARKGPMALVFLDACRFDLGQRLCALLNAGEPQRRAELLTALAPLPSITALGMAFALPMPRSALSVSIPSGSTEWRVEVVGFAGDLSQKQHRDRWLTTRLKAAQLASMEDVLADRVEAASPRSKRLVVVHGAELDTAGHEGQLELTGADILLERYAQVIRRLRDRGYSRVVVVTDHGYFHWKPERDEIEAEKPTGTLRWSSRRAIVGEELRHASALVMPIPQSDLKAAVPRSVNAWKTYGGLGFFHGGATLQELIIPVIVASWPVRSSKVGVVLKPVGVITTRSPRVEVQLAAQISTADTIGRSVRVQIVDAQNRLVFRQKGSLLMEVTGAAADREPRAIPLELVDSPPEGLTFGAALVAILRDADDEAELAREAVTLKVDLDEWD